MGDTILYHGSARIIERPIYGAGKLNNDYGRGFYCTEHLELAKEWACTEGVDGYVNRYAIDLSPLQVMNLSDPAYTILHWLALLMNNRVGRMPTPIAKRGRDYLLANFLPDTADCDVIIGYRADDSYFSFARAFVENGITLSQLGRAMRLGKLGEQVVLRSERAFEAIRWMGYERAESAIWYARRKTRDEAARRAFMQELEAEALDGIYMRDILREEMKPDDARLR